ncbi:MAG: hypothetical protein KBG09_02705 [Syntrophobacterales bacterium]|nr:hypothetical protein [Syntrophobacterales bacterium]
MSRQEGIVVSRLRTVSQGEENLPPLRRMLENLGIQGVFSQLDVSTLPFAGGDGTAGSETELQAVVKGAKEKVDLPLAIEESNYFADILRRARSGDTQKRIVTQLENYLNANEDRVWENSWVRFPRKHLSSWTERIFQQDLLADKEEPAAGLRADVHRFLFRKDGEEWVRLPISYLLKLALAESLGRDSPARPEAIAATGRDLLGHFLNDNTSPETYSFHVVSLNGRRGMGGAVAREMAKRFLLSQLLVMYANERFKLRQYGQEAMVYCSPHPPLRQKQLNEAISDAFYRELFMNPCLSGWRYGEAKHDYMHLCHRVLSRSQLNAVGKLREAGIITSNLVILPHTSNISLANNGTHVSLGSRRLGEAMGDRTSGFTRGQEKYLGDLAVKIVEHFLPLFVGTYTAAPYRLDFLDFHPERALSFLPHELDYTHLRMLWRRWRKKADLKLFGRPLTPFGPPWLDRSLSALCRLRGDFLPDFRLIDYLVALMSTERCPALDGRLSNSDRLKKDLADQGIFSTRMSLYLFEKMREYNVMGFSGFEARHYSLFETFGDDMGWAVELQNLLYCLAFKYIAAGRLDHRHIPDRPFTESERRQVIFGTAIGVPTFFVRKDTDNELLRMIMARTDRVRSSHRYPGYLRVYNLEYRRALLKLIREDGADLLEMFDMGEVMEDLSRRLEEPEDHSAVDRLTAGILRKSGAASPLAQSASDFNLAAERYYREELRLRHCEESLNFLAEDLQTLEEKDVTVELRPALRYVLSIEHPVSYLDRLRRTLLRGEAGETELLRLIYLILLTVYQDRRLAERENKPVGEEKKPHVASVY